MTRRAIRFLSSLLILAGLFLFGGSLLWTAITHLPMPTLLGALLVFAGVGIAALVGERK